MNEKIVFCDGTTRDPYPVIAGFLPLAPQKTPQIGSFLFFPLSRSLYSYGLR